MREIESDGRNIEMRASNWKWKVHASYPRTHTKDGKECMDGDLIPNDITHLSPAGLRKARGELLLLDEEDEKQESCGRRSYY